MSYILDALKKSEQERRRGDVPELTHFESGDAAAHPRRHLWPIVVIVLLVLNAVALFFWRPWNGGPDTASHQEQSETKKSHQLAIQPPPAAILNNTQPPPVVAALPIKPPSVSRQPEPQVIKPSPKASEPSVSPVKTSYLPQLQELPASVQSRVPDMNFSSHMYSSQPRYRSIIINGRRLKEGQYLDDEIQVREITDKGVILGLDEIVFQVDVLGQWVN